MSKKRFKRLRRIQDEESEEEEQKEADEERDAIANELFEGSGDVSSTYTMLVLQYSYTIRYTMQCYFVKYNLHQLLPFLSVLIR